MHATRTLLLVLTSLTATSCVGLNSLIFATKTEFAIDLDSRPPTINIGFKRQEIALGPEFQDGKVHPLLTTIGAKGGAFNLLSDQSYATGDAAIIMAEAFTDDEPYFAKKPIGQKLVKLDGTHAYGNIRTVEGSDSDGVWGTLKYLVLGDDNRKRYFFGTDSLLGLNVEWSGASVPSAVAIGWKRKELAYIPLMQKPALKMELQTVNNEQVLVPAKDANGNPIQLTDKDGNLLVDIRIPSLIATASAGVDVDKPKDTEARVEQTYATGIAATLLAGHPGVRKVLGKALLANLGDVALLEGGLVELADVALVVNILRRLKALAKGDDVNANILIASLQDLAPEIGFPEFRQYEEFDSKNNSLKIKKSNTKAVLADDIAKNPGSPFSYIQKLDSSLKRLQEAESAGALKPGLKLVNWPDGKTEANQALIDEIKKDLLDQRNMLKTKREALARDKRVVEAIKYPILRKE